MTTCRNGALFALTAAIVSPRWLKRSRFEAAIIMTFPITGTLSGWAVIAMPRDAWALKGSQMGIPGSGVIRGKFSSAGTEIFNWAGNICLKMTVFTALYLKCCAKRSRKRTMTPIVDEVNFRLPQPFQFSETQAGFWARCFLA